jgi:small-conductance mechanosensitive channel/CRP-like cAMP-binding protein
VSLWAHIFSEALSSFTLVLLPALVVTLPILRLAAPEQGRRRRSIAALVLLHVVGVVIAAVLRSQGMAQDAEAIRLAAVLCGVIAGVFLLGKMTFLVILPRLKIRAPRIMQDILLLLTASFAALAVASHFGFNVQGLLATSAVVTVVLGFGLQDTLGNVFAGLALQVDDSIRLGDWVSVQDLEGRVTEMRWRYTSIETRDWETLVVPNSVMTKERVLVLGRRLGQATKWRRWVYFNVDFSHQPSDVVEAVERSLRTAQIDDVAKNPEPDCLFTEIRESYATYAVRFFVTNIDHAPRVESVVRTRIFFALARVGIRPSIPAASVLLTEQSEELAQKQRARATEMRLAAIHAVDLFSSLDDGERERLAEDLVYTPFTRGERITRQGETAHWLYIILEGDTSVRVTTDRGLEREVARLGPGQILGEMSLLTGQPRQATIVATSDVEGFRLDKGAFEAVIRERPDVAESMAKLLEERRRQLDDAVHDGDATPEQSRREAETALLSRIRDFFGLPS